MASHGCSTDHLISKFSLTLSPVPLCHTYKHRNYLLLKYHHALKINITNIEFQTTFLAQSSHFCLGHYFNLPGNKTSVQKENLTNRKLKSLSSLPKCFCFQPFCVFSIYSPVPAYEVVWQYPSIFQSPNVIYFSMLFPTLFLPVGFHKSCFNVQLKSHPQPV